MKKISSLIFTIIFFVTSSMATFAYDSILADADLLESNNPNAINITVPSGGEWSVPNAGITVIRGNGASNHVSMADGVSGIIYSDSNVILSKSDWHVSSYGQYDNFSVRGTAPENNSESNTSQHIKIFLKATSSNDLNGLGNQDNEFFNININIEPKIVTKPSDTTPPVISLIGSPEVTVEGGNAYEDLGALAYDDFDGDISSMITVINPVDTFTLGTYKVLYSVSDSSGNESSIDRTVNVVDTTPPELTAPSDINAVLSGPLTNLDLGQPQVFDLFLDKVTNNAPVSGFPVGTTTVEWKAVDTSGNTTVKYQNVHVTYNFGGILKPINTDGSSIFKLGSTIPVKFSLTDSNGQYVSYAKASLELSKVSITPSGPVLQAVSTSSSVTDNAFRYDSTNNIYIFNLNTKPLTTGKYVLLIKLDDGMSYSVQITLR